MTVPVWVPRDASFIDKGSGVVGFHQPNKGGLLVDFEGNRYGAMNMTRYVERVMHAWDRQSTGYPTIARAVITDKDLLIEVGEFDPNKGVITVSKPQLLQEWLGMTEIPASELEL